MLVNRARSLLRSVGMRHGMVMSAASFLASGLDYLFNVYAGRRLDPVEFGILVSVAAILQVLVHLTNVIRNVVAYYTAELGARGAAPAGFLKQVWRWSGRWGLAAAALMALLSPWLARGLNLPGAGPLWAASLALLLLFLRPVTDGALQGRQQFAGLGVVQVSQALLRLLLAALFIAWGWRATGAVLALPAASALALLLALFWLRPAWRGAGEPVAISWRYSWQTLVGLGAFALLTNMDAVLVKRLFSPEIAGNYGPVVTLAKINLFIPLALAMVLFPKATQRHATGSDPRPILGLALAAALLPGLALSALYFAVPGRLVTLVFTDAYGDPGPVLGLVGLATSLYAAVNIWLNYALSVNRPVFVYALLAAAGLQAALLLLWGNSLLDIAWIMVATGLLANVIGALTTLPAAANRLPKKSPPGTSE